MGAKIAPTLNLGPRWGQKSLDLLSLYFCPHLEPRGELIPQYRPPMSFRYISTCICLSWRRGRRDELSPEIVQLLVWLQQSCYSLTSDDVSVNETSTRINIKAFDFRNMRDDAQYGSFSISKGLSIHICRRNQLVNQLNLMLESVPGWGMLSTCHHWRFADILITIIVC